MMSVYPPPPPLSQTNTPSCSEVVYQLDVVLHSRWTFCSPPPSSVHHSTNKQALCLCAAKRLRYLRAIKLHISMCCHILQLIMRCHTLQLPILCQTTVIYDAKLHTVVYVLPNSEVLLLFYPLPLCC